MKEFFRIKDWWGSKAALLMGMVYLFTLWFSIPFNKFIWLALLSITTISGFASLGYLFNDLFDIKKDALTSKRNFIAGKSFLPVLFYFFVAFAFLIFPWKFLPFNFISVLLIAAELLLFLIYAAPPFRLKEKGFAGILTDALYAHALPVALAAYTFALAADKNISTIPFLLLFLWQMLSGIRNILTHQFEDRQQDAASKTKTFVASFTAAQFYGVVKYCIAFELIACICFFISLSISNQAMAVCVGVIFALTASAIYLFGTGGVQKMLESKWKYFPNNIFEKWIPATILLLLSFTDIRFFALLLLHIAAFNHKVYLELLHHVLLPSRGGLRDSLVQIRIGIRRFFSFIINRLIYYSFLLFGVDLKKEDSSALNYLKKQRKQK